ncbi:MAG: hypothetical protein FJY92_05520, partial [Candidatus Hydrogenedentes bacterium]|nr:hypothetical protein [Candidatus Hydrogenedentota bacterium]
MRPLRIGIALYAVVLVLAVYPFSSLPAVDIKVLITHAASLLLLAVYAFCRWRGSVPPGPRGVFMGPIAAFVIVNAIAAFASPYPANALVMVARYFSCAVLYFIAARAVVSVQHAVNLLAAIVLAVAVSSVYGFGQRFGLDPLPWDTSTAAAAHLQHMASTYGNPNLAGHVLILAVLFASYLVTHRRTRWVGVLLPLLLGHLACTGLRTGWGALGLALVLAAAAWRVRQTSVVRGRSVRGPALRLVLSVAVLGVVGAVGIAFYSGPSVSVDSSLVLRCNSFYSGARMAADRPLLGFGPDNYRMLNVQYWTPYE